MPEGDSVAGDAARLRPVLLGNRIEAVAGTSSRVRANSPRLLDATVTEIRTAGKHLVMDFSSGYSLHIHLGMSGRWEIGDRDRRPHGSARVVLYTSTHQAACYSAPSIDVDRTGLIDRALTHLGPDVVTGLDVDVFVRRARSRGDRPIAATLLDQRVMSGVGNVYKSELLFLAGIHPWTRTADVTDEQLRDLGGRAHHLVSANVGQRRTTTGSPRRGQETWVYGQAGHGCVRCGTRIELGRLDGRVTYWCPTCQPARFEPS
ncbi:MAG: DNA-formamidopyrimidine glycosylase family protein [Acidimicrobiia bacterium]